jgi:hypothetical protein
MSTEKLSELSKPVAYDYQIAGACIADGHNENGKWVDWNNKLSRYCPPDWMVEEGKVTELKPLYSQEYVSALTQRIAELEDAEQKLCAANVTLDARASAAEAKLATPVRLLGEMLLHDWEHSVERQATFQHRKIAWDARLAEDKKAILAAGFTFTVEGDE